MGRREEKGRAAIEHFLHRSKRACPPASREQCFPVHPPSPTCTPDLRPPAIPEGWPHHSGRRPPQGICLPRPARPLEGLHPRGVAPSTTSPLEELPGPETPEQALPRCGKSASTTGQSCQFQLPWGSTPLFLSSQLATPALRRCCTGTWSSRPEPPPPGRAPQPRNTRASSARPREVCIHLGKFSFASE